MLINYLKSKLKNKIDDYLHKFHSNFDKKNIKLNNSELGENVFIANNNIITNSVIGNNIKIGSDSNLYNVKYGDFSYNSIRVSMMNCSIGRFCSIAGGVYIGSGKHPVNKYVSTHPIFYSPNKQCGISLTEGKSYFDEMGYVTIGNDVWIGLNCIIADDVKIGNGVIIAANSFVNKDIPDYAIVAGSPAKIIKYRFEEDEIQFLLKFKWWDKDIEWLKDNFKMLHDIKTFIANYSNSQ